MQPHVVVGLVGDVGVLAVRYVQVRGVEVARINGCVSKERSATSRECRGRCTPHDQRTLVRHVAYKAVPKSVEDETGERLGESIGDLFGGRHVARHNDLTCHEVAQVLGVA